jgi:hypothetical protein
VIAAMNMPPIAPNIAARATPSSARITLNSHA